MKQLLLDVKNRLSSSSSLKHIDTDWGQLDLLTPPVSYPCALVDIVQGQFEDESEGFQIGILTLSVKIADVTLSPGSKSASLSQKDKALSIIDSISEVNWLLHGWSGSDHYGPLTRVSIMKNARQDGIREYVVSYKVQITDDSGIEQGKTIKKNTVTFQLEKE
jgi:hypothetical protein